MRNPVRGLWFAIRGGAARSLVLGAWSFLALWTLNLGPSAAAAVPAKPNIIFILADDLGYGEIGCYGQKIIQTPRIDQMAREGMRFTQFYAGATVRGRSRQRAHDRQNAATLRAGNVA